MADSLRDQLIAAGFDAPKKEARKKPKSGAGAGSNKRPGNKPPGSNPNKRQATGKPQRGPATKKSGASRSTTSGGPQNSTGNRNKTNSDNEAKDNEAKDNEAKIEERKKLKAQIKILIDDNKTETWKGEIVYRYLVDKKIRELYVSEELHPKLTAREVAITRYNGETYIVPRETGKEIKDINPQWSVFNLEKDETTTESEKLEGDYAEFQVPDDLQW